MGKCAEQLSSDGFRYALRGQFCGQSDTCRVYAHVPATDSDVPALSDKPDIEPVEKDFYLRAKGMHMRMQLSIGVQNDGFGIRYSVFICITAFVTAMQEQHTTFAKQKNDKTKQTNKQIKNVKSKQTTRENSTKRKKTEHYQRVLLCVCVCVFRIRKIEREW